MTQIEIDGFSRTVKDWLPDLKKGEKVPMKFHEDELNHLEYLAKNCGNEEWDLRLASEEEETLNTLTSGLTILSVASGCDLRGFIRLGEDRARFVRYASPYIIYSLIYEIRKNRYSIKNLSEMLERRDLDAACEHCPAFKMDSETDKCTHYPCNRTPAETERLAYEYEEALKRMKEEEKSHE